MTDPLDNEIGPFVVDRFLGQGTTGKVVLAHHKENKNKVAIKIIPKVAFKSHQNLLPKVQREIALMRLAKHSNIIKLIDVLESENHLYIILEYAEKGQLFDYLIINRFLCADIAIEFFRQIIFAIEYLHLHGICHRDLKPENILLDNAMRIKIADFGFARWVSSELLTDACGSIHYAAPEVISAKPYDGKAADVWSMGIILFALVAGYLPFEDDSPSRLKAKIQRGTFSIPEFDPKIKDLLKKMLTVDPKKRITVSQIKEHPCFRWGLPDDYILPSPLSVEVDELLNIPSEVMSMIDKLCSLSHDQFINELKSKSHNLPKVIVSMLSSHLDLEQLPWERSISFSKQNPESNKTSENEVQSEVEREVAIQSKEDLNSKSNSNSQLQQPQLDDSSIMHSLSNVSLDNIQTKIDSPTNSGSDPFHRHLSNAEETVEVNSLAKRPGWEFVDEIKSDILSEISLKLVGVKLCDLMRTIQKALDTSDLKMLYPDPTHLFVKGKNGIFYTEIETQPLDEETINSRFILRKGDTNAFTIFTNYIISSIKKLPTKSS